MALKTAMTSTTNELLYNGTSVGSSEEDFTSAFADDSFHLRISDDEDLANSEEERSVKKVVSKETEDEILDKFKCDDVVTENVCLESEENLLADADEDNLKILKDLSNFIDEKTNTDDESVKKTGNLCVNEEKEKKIEMCKKSMDENDDECVKHLEKIVESIATLCHDITNESKEKTEENDQKSNEKDSCEIVEENLNQNKSLPEETTKIDESYDQNEIFKCQTNDTENLLEVLSVEPIEDRNVVTEKEHSSSDNSDKDENEEESEFENEKTDTPITAEESDEKVEEKVVNEPIDLIDIEENIIIDPQEKMNDASVDVSGNDEKMETNSLENQTNQNEMETTPPTEEEETVKETEVVDETINNDNKVEDLPSTFKSSKRSLKENDIDMDNKRVKLTKLKETSSVKSTTNADLNTEINSDSFKKRKLKVLTSINKFMRNKNLKGLSRDDLEQLVLQKICESLMFSSEVGELRHKIKSYEQIFENWRKEMTVLVKRARDLETVTTRLISDYKLKHEKDKPIMPLKITRSVGLQVLIENCDLAKENTVNDSSNSNKRKKKLIRSSTNSLNNVPSAPPIVIPLATTTVAINENNAQQSTPTTSNKVAQKSNSTNSKPDSSTENNPSSSFIDLTEEDDKKNDLEPNEKDVIRRDIPKTQTTSKNSFRLIPTAVASAAARLMYIVNTGNGSTVLTTTSPPQNGLTINQTSTATPGPSLASIQTKVLNALNNSKENDKNVEDNEKVSRHPAALPQPPPPSLHQTQSKSWKPVPPKPRLQIRKCGTAIVLSWKMPYNLSNYETIGSYQLYAYQETDSLPSTDMWRKVGDIKALELPMACTLTQFADGNGYHFAVRAVDVFKRYGPFSDPGYILL